MKKITSILLTFILATYSLQARVFENGERLYINMEAQSVKDQGGDLQYGWYSTMSNYNYAYFFNESNGSNAWSDQVKYYDGTVWYVETPAGDWDHVILTRHSSANPNWDTKITQTGDISFYYIEGGVKKMREQNYIQNFYYGSSHEEANWEFVAPAPSGNPSTWSYEDEQICTDAAGTKYMLQAKNYDYDNTYAHAWFKYESNTWKRLQGEEWRTAEGDKAFEVTLGAVNSDVYYFLQCSRPSMCRLIRIRINKNCSEGAPGACKITSFVAVASDANVTDKTSAINGVVAFDDKKNAGNLQIWCPNIDTIIINNAAIETPQTFKLEGFDASATKSYTLYAKFLGGTGCDASCNVTVTPPSISPVIHTTTGTTADERLTRFTEEDVTLTPDNQTSTYFMWTNSANNDTIIGSGTDNRNLTFDAPVEGTTIDYYFLATNDPPSPEGNLISNGTFETETNLDSKYNYWGKDLTNYYDSHSGASGGYAIVKDSYSFYHTYNSVKAHEGQYFGLFDSKVTSNVEDQAAWIAKSGTKNPKLKVHAGVSYLFSFWVANINAYYQMNNGARLQFQISYNGGTTWNDLGGEINLGNYKDNRWHGLSSIATPSTTSGNVALRVINKNTSDKNIGNDFALDDIRFEAITSSSSNIAGYERFPVKYIECVINSATFEQRQPLGCGTAIADVDFTVNFTNPRGDLYIYEGTTLLAKISHSEIGDNATSYTGVLANQPVDNADHTLTVYFDDGHVKTDAPTTYTYNAKNVPAINIKSLAWGTPACDQSTIELTAVIKYTNQNGILSANVDGGTSISETYSIESDEEEEVTIVISGIVADGKDNHKLNISFDGSHGCSITDYIIPASAPITPHIDTAKIAFSELGCNDLTTALVFNLDYTYQQGTFSYSVDTLPAQTATYNIADKSKQTLSGLTVTNIPADGKNNHILHISFDGPNSCAKDYVLPAVPFSPAINSVSVSGVPAAMECNDSLYTANVVITTPYDATGRDIVLSFDDNGPKSQTVTATGTNTSVIVTLHNIGSGETTISAAYETSPACEKKSALFTPPTRTPCLKYEDTICEGESYNKHGFNISVPPVGIDTLLLNGDTLILTVVATPTITIASSYTVCDSESDIRLPFTVEKGSPDSFVIRLNGVDYEATIDNNELVITRPNALSPGSYSAIIFVGQKGEECSSTISASVRIDDSHIMYRKWEDVLFIDNSSNRCAEYQWFENGKEIPGETGQYLYNPNGLPGTYFCRVTTTDGAVFYTCELPFEQVTRSRDVTNDKQPAQIIRQYHVSPHVYVVHEQIGDKVQTRKIITPYE